VYYTHGDPHELEYRAAGVSQNKSAPLLTMFPLNLSKGKTIAIAACNPKSNVIPYISTYKDAGATLQSVTGPVAPNGTVDRPSEWNALINYFKSLPKP
jgi:hypothetical protein